MSESGTYILNEYFILKLIFSYLPSRDLHSAAKVCRNWNVIATRALAENGEPQSCCVLNGNDVVPPFNEKQSPTIILDFAANSPAFGAGSAFGRVLHHLHDTYYLENTSVYHIHADPYVFSWKSAENSVIGSLTSRAQKGSDPVHSLMLLSNMPGVNINCFQEFQKRIVKAEDGTMANLEHISRAKGVILIVGSRNSSANQAQLLLDEIIEICKSNNNTQSELVLAGGITRNILRAQKVFQKTEVLGVTFSGENVTIDGDIHIPHKMVLEEFMQAFSKRVGKIPEDSLRLAFAFICTNRKDTYRDINLFKEFFPGVPIYGFYSYGEYFLHGLKGETSCSKAKKSAAYTDNENYFYTDSCSFLIVTLRKSKGTSITSNK